MSAGGQPSFVHAQQLKDHVLSSSPGAEIVLMMTWRDRNKGGYDSLRGVPGGNEGYVAAAHQIGARVAPVGWVYKRAIDTIPGFDGWKADDHHANDLGRWIAACTIHATITGESPVGLHVPKFLDHATALDYQKLIRDTVFDDLADWNIPVSNPPVSRTKVVLKADDAMEAPSKGGRVDNRVGLKLGKDRIVAMRFRNVEVPAGATVQSARVHTMATSGKTLPITLEWRGSAFDDAPVPGSADGALSAIATGAATITDTPAAWRGGKNYDEGPEIASIVQEIVSRPGWQRGNALTLVVDGTSSSAQRGIQSAMKDVGTTKSPVLVVEYTT